VLVFVQAFDDCCRCPGYAAGADGGCGEDPLEDAAEGSKGREASLTKEAPKAETTGE
jgi:hypothetical protein